MQSPIESIATEIDLTAIFAASLSIPASKAELTGPLQATLSTCSGVFAVVRNRTVVLSGHFESLQNKRAALHAVHRIAGVDTVIDNTVLIS